MLIERRRVLQRLGRGSTSELQRGIVSHDTGRGLCRRPPKKPPWRQPRPSLRRPTEAVRHPIRHLQPAPKRRPLAADPRAAEATPRPACSRCDSRPPDAPGDESPARAAVHRDKRTISSMPTQLPRPSEERRSRHAWRVHCHFAERCGNPQPGNSSSRHALERSRGLTTATRSAAASDRSRTRQCPSTRFAAPASRHESPMLRAPHVHRGRRPAPPPEGKAELTSQPTSDRVAEAPTPLAVRDDCRAHRPADTTSEEAASPAAREPKTGRQLTIVGGFHRELAS